MTELRNNQRKQVIGLITLAGCMLGFAYALVPLYEVFCEVTGLNGKTSGAAADVAEVSQIRVADSDREVTIQFLAHVGNGMPWEFRPTEHQLRVRLGEINTTNYYARNRAAQAVTGQAVPSVTPGNGARYLHKVECFCFRQQRLAGGEAQQIPLKFYIGTDLPEEIHTLSLSYTLFKVPERVSETAAAVRGAVSGATLASIHQ